MNNIMNNVEELKKLIEESEEYKEYDRLTKILDTDKEINEIIDEIKKLQKEAVNKEVKKEDTKNIEEKLDNLFEELNNKEKYIEYIEASKKLNKLITEIQDRFSNSFNEILN